MALANDIDDAFVKQFESDVHLAYQRMGAKLVPTVRTKTDITGSSTTFQKAGVGAAATKSRNGDIPIVNRDHTPVEVTLTDFYAGEYIDRLDELKINHDERMVAAQSIAAAMGRKSDELIIDEIDTNASNATSSSGAITLAKVEQIYESFGNNDVPDDGQRFLVVSPQGWTDLLGIDQFANADYVSPENVTWPGSQNTIKYWLSFYVMQHSGLNKSSTTRTSIAYHKRAVAFASGSEIQMSGDFVPTKHATLVSAAMSQAAKIIDDNGVFQLQHTES